MLIKTGRTAALFVFVCTVLQIFSVNAVELGAFGDRIFSFQKKLALKGNTLAQYKLGTLYEYGISVKPDVQEASNWYKKAAKKDYVPAINRLTYLDIRTNGYDKAKHASWFKSLIVQVEEDEPNALILLGEMYRYGINVKRDLEKSLAFLEKASSYGHTEIDSVIDEIYVELDTIAAAEEAAKSEEANTKKQGKAKKPTKKAAPKPTVSKKAIAKTKRENSKEARRLKYERAMLQLRKEALLMQEQQQWAEEGESE